MIDNTYTVTAALPLPKSAPSGATAEALTLVQMADVDPDPRNELRMSDTELQELGESIDARGLMQPPMLRLIPETGRLMTIAGHHRIEAMRRIGFESFFAIVGAADNDSALEMLMMSNLQSKVMSTAQVASFVSQLLTKHKSMDKVCQIMKKSKPWVSKHIAVTRPDFGKIAQKMLARGECEDLEILGMISQLEKLDAMQAIEDLRAEPPISRAKARAALKVAKAKPEPDENSENEDDATCENEMRDNVQNKKIENINDEMLAAMIDRAITHGMTSKTDVDRARHAIAHLSGGLNVDQPMSAAAMTRLLDMIDKK